MLQFIRAKVSDAFSPEVQLDPGGGANKTAKHFAPPGDDSPPLPEDFAAVTSGPGSGDLHAIAYQDPGNEGKAEPGEVRRYARDPNGAPVAELWLKGDGSIEILSIAGSTVTINGVVIDQNGNITTPGDVTAMDGTPATAVNLSSHLHPTGTGPSGPPQGGT